MSQSCSAAGPSAISRGGCVFAVDPRNSWCCTCHGFGILLMALCWFVGTRAPFSDILHNSLAKKKKKWSGFLKLWQVTFEGPCLCSPWLVMFLPSLLIFPVLTLQRCISEGSRQGPWPRLHVMREQGHVPAPELQG